MRKRGVALRVTCALAVVLAPACSSSPVPSAFVPDASDSGPRRDVGVGHDAFVSGGDTGVLHGATDAGCTTLKKKAEPVPINVVLGIDNSFSMDFLNKWTNLSAALDTFVTDPASSTLNLGIQFFPLRETCLVSAYEDLAVAVGPQPMAAPLIEAAIASRRMSGGTPTVQLLQGLVANLTANAQAGVKSVIVLATDGVPDATCLYAPDGGTPNSLVNAEAIAMAAFQGTPSIPTFVIGVGSELGPLDALASAGGTGTATLVDVAADAGNAEQAFVDALNAIRTKTIPCDFVIPAGTQVDPSQTNVTYTPGAPGSAPQTFVYVAVASACAMAPTDGWYFDDPTDPTEAILCPAACQVVTADPGAEVDVALGCPRVDLK